MIIAKMWQIVKQMKFKILEKELSSTETYKEDTSFKQKLGIINKILNKVNNEKYERETKQTKYNGAANVMIKMY